VNVNPSGSYPQTSRTVNQPAARGVSTPKGEEPAAGTSAPAEAASFLPTGDLTRLLAAVRDTPEVRADVIESVAARLAAGQFDTPEAAADTARALLGSGE
jgi:hypothetical protein